jgi:hypothetical protein
VVLPRGSVKAEVSVGDVVNSIETELLFFIGFAILELSRAQSAIALATEDNDFDAANVVRNLS